MNGKMNSRFLVLFIVWISSVCCTSQGVQDHLDCPPWFFYNSTAKQCECYSSPSTDQAVKCTKKEALLKLGYCMTYEEESASFHVGLCNNIQVSRLNVTTDNYIRLPSNVSNLNDYMCEPMNRKGRICSQCVEGFGLAVFSVEQECVSCMGAWYGIPLYLFIEFVPITIFYFIVMFFHINVTSAPMIAFVFYSQIAISSFSHISNKLIFNTTVTYQFLRVLASLYGIWNLDFFRLLIPPFCVSPHIKPIHVTFLNFISAVYPLCLIAISWIFIHLYSRSFKPIVWIRNKMKQIINFCNCFKVSPNSTNTITDVFATFFLLSYAKLMYISLRSLFFRNSLSLMITNVSLQRTLHVVSDPTMKYFGTEHLPFAIISLFIFLSAVLPIPILLTLYPFRRIRLIFFKCPICNSRTITAINIFVERFYSCYRDSTGDEGGRDMRFLVSIYFFPRLLIHSLTIDKIPPNVGFSILVFVYMACSTLIALAQPYKKKYMNIADALILLNLALLSLTLAQLSSNQPNTSIVFYYTIGSILASLPLLILIGVLIYKMIQKIAKLNCCIKLLQWNQCSRRKDEDQNSITESLDSHEYHEMRELVVTVVTVKEYDEYQS